MARKSDRSAKGKKKARTKRSGGSTSLGESLLAHTDIVQNKTALKKVREDMLKLEERLQDVEIHVNLLTRLLTTLCIEKFGMRVGVLKRLIKRIEKEAIRDSQILHLESLYKMSSTPPKKNQNPPHSAPKDDPWEDIS